MEDYSKKGIFIPQEIIDDDRLNIYEVMLLSYYKYYTEYGKLKCCKKTNDEILGELKKFSKRTLFRCKSHLIELGLIRTDGGIRVYYIGGKQAQNDTTKEVTDECLSDTDECLSDTHNKEIKKKKEKKEEKKEKEEYKEEKNGPGPGPGPIEDNNGPGPIEDNNNNEMKDNKETPKTNFDKIISYLPSYYRKEEHINYIKDNLSAKIDCINKLKDDELNISLYTQQIKEYINKQFGPEEYVEEEKPHRDKRDGQTQLEDQFNAGFCYMGEDAFDSISKGITAPKETMDDRYM